MTTSGFINYAHRGASACAPENTMSAFRLGLTMGANGIETDVQRTKDGVLVLFHDRTLRRVTGAEGSIQDHTYDELLALKVHGGGTADAIVRFSDFLHAFSEHEIGFAIEIKQEHIETEIIDLLESYHMCEKTILTSFMMDSLVRAKHYAPQYKAGYLAREIDPSLLKMLKEIGVEQICPDAAQLTPDLVKTLHQQGFSVRAWGVKTEELMKKVYDAGADGMTVNFPDKLTAYIASKTR